MGLSLHDIVLNVNFSLTWARKIWIKLLLMNVYGRFNAIWYFLPILNWLCLRSNGKHVRSVYNARSTFDELILILFSKSCILDVDLSRIVEYTWSIVFKSGCLGSYLRADLLLVFWVLFQGALHSRILSLLNTFLLSFITPLRHFWWLILSTQIAGFT